MTPAPRITDPARLAAVAALIVRLRRAVRP